MPNKDEDKLGRLGEKALDTWATQADITINRAYEDNQGWDFILEFPLAYSRQSGNEPSLDLRPYPLKCFIQVKSTNERPGSRQVKLDNWERLVKNPLPAFILVCEFDGEDECQRAYLVHVDQSYIERVLRRLRELSAAGIHDVYKHTLTLHYDNSHLLSTLNGKGLVDAIKHYVGEDLQTYSSAKMEYIDKVGYGEDSYRVKFTVELPDAYSADPLEFLIDSILGLIPQLEPSLIEIKDARFGIEVPGQEEIIEGGTIRIGELTSVATAVICFSLPHQIKDLKVELETFVPQGIAFEGEDEHRKILFKAPFIEVVARPKPNVGRLNFHMPITADRFPLKDLQRVSELVLMCEDALQTSSSLEFEILIDSKQVMVGSLNVAKEGMKLSQDVIDAAKAVMNAWKIAKYADIQDSIQVSVIEVIKQLPLLDFVAATIERRNTLLRLEFFLSEDEAAEVAQMCCPIIPTVVLGNIKVLVALAVVGKPEVLPNTESASGTAKCILETGVAELHGARCISREVDSRPLLRRLHEQITKCYEPDYDILSAPDLHSYLLTGNEIEP